MTFLFGSCHSSQYPFISTQAVVKTLCNSPSFAFFCSWKEFTESNPSRQAPHKKGQMKKKRISTTGIMCFCCCWCHHLTTAELTVWRHDTLVFASLISEAVWRRNQVRVSVSARIVQRDAPQLVPVFCPRQCLIHVFPKSWMQTSTSHQCHPLVSAQRHPSIFTSSLSVTISIHQLSISHFLAFPSCFSSPSVLLPYLIFFTSLIHPSPFTSCFFPLHLLSFI